MKAYKTRPLRDTKVTADEPHGVDHWTDGADTHWWGVNVDDDGVAYTFYESQNGPALYPGDDEIQHVQDFFAGKYCWAQGNTYINRDKTCRVNPLACFDKHRAGTWK